MGFNNKDKDNSPRELHDAVCAECNKKCQVPFKPSGNKPVKCSDCFKKDGDGVNSRGWASRNFSSDKPRFSKTQDYTKQLDAISFKMDKIIQLLQGGTLERPEGSEASRKRERLKEEKQVVDSEDLKNTIGDLVE